MGGAGGYIAAMGLIAREITIKTTYPLSVGKLLKDYLKFGTVALFDLPSRILSIELSCSTFLFLLFNCSRFRALALLSRQVPTSIAS